MIERRRAIPPILALLVTIGCRSSPSAAPPEPSVPCDSTALVASSDSIPQGQIAVHLESGGDANLEIVRNDLRSYLGKLWSSPIDVATSAPLFDGKTTLWISTSVAARSRAGFSGTDGYAIKRVDNVIVVTAENAHDLAYGAYALLEMLGVRFFHPKQELVPTLPGPRIPKSIDVVRTPAWASRGVQLHTLHPIETFAAFLEPSADNLADAKQYIDWLTKTGQNLVQWPLLSSVPFEPFAAHARSILDYAHVRGVKVGAVVQVFGGSSLQNNYVLLSDPTKGLEPMDAQLDRLMTIPWDVVELALGEFFSTDPKAVVAAMDRAVARLSAARPALEINVQNHVGNYPKLYVPWDGTTVYFYHLGQFADPRLGQTVHTLAFFDLYRDWATYKHTDFHAQRDYIFQMLPTRRVKYFPESAYWIGADIDVPLFLPMYLQARWNDVHGLVADVRDKKLPAPEGHVTFNSGYEWGYWLTEYLTAKMLWRGDEPLANFLSDFGAAFGSCAPEITSALSSFLDLQNKRLFDQRLVAYLQGENNTTDLGYAAGYETHPKRVEFQELLAMNEPDRGKFETDVIVALEAMVKDIRPLEDTVAARCRGADATIAPWCNELWDGMKIVRLRAEHAAHLYRSILAKTRGGDVEPEFAAAKTASDGAAKVIAAREKGYRFDSHRLNDAYANPTIYGFGYLRQTHTLCYWTRREEQVRYLLDNGVPAGLIGLPSCQE